MAFIVHGTNANARFMAIGGALYKGFVTEAEAREAKTLACGDYIGKNAKEK